MKLYPAIDMMGGKAVRLQQGSFDHVTRYGLEPAEVAKAFEKAGAEYIHTVDLDGALAGSAVNLEALRRLVDAVKIPVQNGGGIRSMEQIEERLSCGVSRVILGTAAVHDPEFLKRALDRFGPERIVVGIDAKDGFVAVSGWAELSGTTASALGRAMAAEGLTTCVYTDISRDGMLSGPNIPATVELGRETGLSVILSGGVSCIDDLLEAEKAGITGAIVGKAVYENRIDLAEALRLLSERRTE